MSANTKIGSGTGTAPSRHPAQEKYSEGESIVGVIVVACCSSTNVHGDVERIKIANTVGKLHLLLLLLV
jgi:hypothetical protein